MKPMGYRLACAALAAAAITGSLSGCVPLVVGGGMATAALSAADRRTTGTQVEDQGIELRAQERLRQSPLNDRARISVTSFNRKALITGEVRSEQDKAEAGRIVREVNNVDGIYNELEVTPFSSSLAQRSKDTMITSQVKGSLINARDIQSGRR